MGCLCLKIMKLGEHIFLERHSMARSQIRTQCRDGWVKWPNLGYAGGHIRGLQWPET